MRQGRLPVTRPAAGVSGFPSSLQLWRRREPTPTCSDRSHTSKKGNEHQRHQNSIANTSSVDERWPSAKASSQNFVQDSGLSTEQTDKMARMARLHQSGTLGATLSATFSGTDRYISSIFTPPSPNLKKSAFFCLCAELTLKLLFPVMVSLGLCSGHQNHARTFHEFP